MIRHITVTLKTIIINNGRVAKLWKSVMGKEMLY